LKNFSKYTIKSNWTILRTPGNFQISFTARDEGCLGNMTLILNNKEQLRWAYKDYYPSARSFFLPPRCNLCHDQCAELADLAFGDLHISEFWDDKVGIGSVIARSSAAQELLCQAQVDGAIILSPLEKTLVSKSQHSMLIRKKLDIPIRIRLLSKLGYKVPKYDTDFLKPSARDWLRSIRATIVLEIEGVIGINRKLWWIIRAVSHATPPKRNAISSVSASASDSSCGKLKL